MPEQIRYDEEPQPFYRRVRDGVRRTLRTLSFILVVLHATALVISRTPGFRSWLANELSRRWRCSVSLGGVAISPLLSLRLRDLEIASPVQAQSVVGQAREVSVRWFNRPKIFVRGGSLEWIRLQRGNALDNWLDTVAVAAAMALDLKGLDLPAELPPVELRLEECNLAWKESGTTPTAEARNLHFIWMPLPTPVRLAFAQVEAEFYEGTNAPARRISNSVLLSADGQRFELLRASHSATAEPRKP
jgi:hypothetical protein